MDDRQIVKQLTDLGVNARSAYGTIVAEVILKGPRATKSEAIDLMKSNGFTYQGGLPGIVENWAVSFRDVREGV